tara:strand:- start:695 stop:985 length:291 start_codon:yes stop_codon:yes gene_type:complete
MGDAARWLGVCRFDVAAAVELAAGFDNQFGYADFAADLAGADNFQALGIDTAINAAANHNFVRTNFAVKFTANTNGDVVARIEFSGHAAVEVKIVA